VRGRFNIGEKEIISVAESAVVYTTTATISFPKSGGRKVFKPKRAVGTKVVCVMPWGPRQVEVVVENLKKLLVPKGIRYTVNGVLVSYREPDYVVDATLDTVLQDAPNEPLRPTRRKTTVEIYRNNGAGLLYELGIPVQKIDSPYIVNVGQKVPLPPNRDMVRDSYLKELYGYVLNATKDDIPEEDVSQTWVRNAVESKSVEPEAVTRVFHKRYGEKAVLWSRDPLANERAEENGYVVIHPRTLSPSERESMKEHAGLVHSSDKFGMPYGTAEDLDPSEYTDGMNNIALYAKMLAKELIKRNIRVSVYRMPDGAFSASWSDEWSLLSFNLSHLGHAFFDSGATPQVTGLLLHEFAHYKGTCHNWEYKKALQDLSGKCVHLALAKPSLFEEYTNG